MLKMCTKKNYRSGMYDLFTDYYLARNFSFKNTCLQKKSSKHQSPKFSGCAHPADVQLYTLTHIVYQMSGH